MNNLQIEETDEEIAKNIINNALKMVKQKNKTRTLKQISENRMDFKVCNNLDGCAKINYHDNEKCVECGNKSFHKITKKEILECIQICGEDEEIEVR